MKNLIIQRGAVYNAEQIIQSFGISPQTLSKWQRDGLRFSQSGTRRRYFLGDDVIEFLFGGNHEPYDPINRPARWPDVSSV